MRYTSSVVLLCISGAALVGAIVLLVVVDGSATGLTLLAVGLGLAAFIGAAVAVGRIRRIRRIRSVTPEAIIGDLVPPTD